MSGQDWAQITIGAKAPPAAAGPKWRGSVSVTSKGIPIAKLDSETEELRHKTVGKDLSLAVQSARTAKGLTQKQLAHQLNVQHSVVADYEAGRGVPNNAFVAKMERALAVKLPRAAR